MTILMHNNTIFHDVTIIPNNHSEFSSKFYEIRHSKGTSLINKDMIEVVDLEYEDMQKGSGVSVSVVFHEVRY